jgi:diamine N-acetyltransferase
MISGEKISLRAATIQERKQIFEWLAQSDLTSSMLGPPLFADNPVPSWDSFIEDYHTEFFNYKNPYNGRSFIIEAQTRAVGHINYNPFDKEIGIVEFDIWLSSLKECGKGYGTDAILTLCNYLHSNYNCNEFILAPSARNTRAIEAYKKAGFRQTTILPDNFVPDYSDTVVMKKSIQDRGNVNKPQAH